MTYFLKMKTYSLIILLFFSLLAYLPGCVGLGPYGKLRITVGKGQNVTIEELEETWRNYHVYYAGVRIASPSAVVFDIRGDDRTITYHEWWTEVRDGEDLSDLIKGLRLDEYPPRLWQVSGPENQLYGYMYTARTHALIKVVDPKTLWIDEMTLPERYSR